MIISRPLLFSPQALSLIATNRTTDLFQPDFDAKREELRAGIEGRRVLAIGGAGSIGSSTVLAICSFQPRCVHVVDQSENSLAELARDFRSSPVGASCSDFRTLPLDYGSPLMWRFLCDAEPYELVLNFAALKHVRSEKDVYSLLQMFDTNLLKQARFMAWLSRLGSRARYFSVSTDKAANPVNLMGASKRLMEHILFSEESSKALPHVTSARFANVAFSDGSLLSSFFRRLEKRQPIAVPRETRRYFVSLQEAAQICILAAVCIPHQSILIPRLDAGRDLRELQTVAIGFLQQHGLEPELYQEEDEARCAVERDLARNRYPLLLSALDTSGEKEYEEFVAEGEETFEVGMDRLLAIKYRRDGDGSTAELIGELERIISGDRPHVDKSSLVELVSLLIPQFRHRETGKFLDDRM